MEFLVHVADVIADRFLTDLETPGDLFVRLTDRDQLENHENILRNATRPHAYAIDRCQQDERGRTQQSSAELT